MAKSARKAKATPKPGPEVRLLSGGNPQIPKGDGEGPIRAYIAAMPGWKRAIGRRLDALISAALPAATLRKAVKWNSPLYGVDGQGWFLSLHCFDRYVKVTFFRGKSLTPLPPGESTQKHVRALNIHETDTLDEAQFSNWVLQASRLPGEDL